MARILAVTWDGSGNVPPMLGVAGELRGRGHEVRVLGHPRQRADVEGAGLAFDPYAHAVADVRRQRSCPGRIGAEVAAAGAGRVLLPTAHPEQIRDAIRALLADGPHRAAAAAIGARLRAQDGAGAAADEIEAVLALRVDRDAALG